MIRKTCEDCGTRLERNGTCPNCHEEKFIFEWQEVENPSEEFMDKVAEQSKQITDRNRR